MYNRLLDFNAQKNGQLIRYGRLANKEKCVLYCHRDWPMRIYRGHSQKVTDNMSAIKPQDYAFIAKWGEQMGSSQAYIKEMQRVACSQHAPLNAIYRDANLRWQTTNDIENNDIRKKWGLPLMAVDNAPLHILMSWQADAKRKLVEAMQRMEEIQKEIDKRIGYTA